MMYWFSRFCFGLWCEVLCEIYGVFEFDLFVNVIFFKLDLVVLIYDFYSSNSRMIDGVLEKNSFVIFIVIFW